jgi:FKBP-type peptidyl-prolyl cis-trans isomerase FklB
MSRYLFLSLCVIFSVAHAAEKTQENDAHDLAYSLGASLGERLRQEVPRPATQGPDRRSAASLSRQATGIERRTDRTDPRPNTKRGMPCSHLQPQSEPATGKRAAFSRRRKSQTRCSKELADGILLTELAPGTGAKAGPERQSAGAVCRSPCPTAQCSTRTAQPQWFSLDSVISGWRSALQNMPVGAKWRLVIPSAQAYGADGAGDLIAPFTPWCLKSNCAAPPVDSANEKRCALAHRFGVLREAVQAWTESVSL